MTQMPGMPVPWEDLSLRDRQRFRDHILPPEPTDPMPETLSVYSHGFEVPDFNTATVFPAPWTHGSPSKTVFKFIGHASDAAIDLLILQLDHGPTFQGTPTGAVGNLGFQLVQRMERSPTDRELVELTNLQVVTADSDNLWSPIYMPATISAAAFGYPLFLKMVGTNQSGTLFWRDVTRLLGTLYYQTEV